MLPTSRLLSQKRTLQSAGPHSVILNSDPFGRVRALTYLEGASEKGGFGHILAIRTGLNIVFPLQVCLFVYISLEQSLKFSAKFSVPE